MNESAQEGADTDESTGRELWQIRPADTLAGISSCTYPFSPLHNRDYDSRSERLKICTDRIATVNGSLRRSPCLLRCGRGNRTHTAGRLRRPRKPARREWRPEGATSPAVPDRRKPGVAVAVLYPAPCGEVSQKCGITAVAVFSKGCLYAPVRR